MTHKEHYPNYIHHFDQTTQMASAPRRIFNKISSTLTSSRINHSSGRTSPRGNINQEKIRCYSVCVARLAIMAMLAILIGLLTLLTWHFTKVYTRTSLNALAFGLRYELLQRPMLRMWKILNSTVEITTSQVKLSEYVIRKYSKAENQAQQVELYEVMRDVTWALFASHKALNSMSIKYRNGFVQAFHRDLRDKNTYYIYSNLYNYTMVEPYDVNQSLPHQGWNDQTIHGNISAIWYREPLDPDTGRKTGKQKEIPPDELMNIAGISQVPDGAASWHIAVSKFTSSPLLSAALPVLDEGGGSIVAVVGVTTALYSVGQLMKELVELHDGHIYLTSQEGWLLATSNSSTPLLRSSPSGPTLMMAVDSEDEIIKSGAKWVEKAYGGQPPVTRKVHTAAARLGHQRYYIDSFFLNLTRLPMVGVLCIPRKYIMGKVDARAFKTLMILISASVCVLVVGCICIFILTNGVSKEMKLRAELISHYDARRKAEASSNFKSQFLANMSHELRTPMAAVIGLLDILLCDECLTNEQSATITQIRRCSTALLRLLNNILDISKVESGKLVLEEAEFDLGRELEGLVDMFSVQCKNHNVETIIDLSDDMPKVVRGDSGRVVQIFANLISNSIKFTTSGYIIVRGWSENLKSFNENEKFYVDEKALWSAFQKRLKKQGLHEKTCSKNDNTMILYFEVEDTGCGIDPSKWESVFESFEQADPSTTRLHGGTGLGLCIVRSLVNKMGGEIRVVKKNGSGTLMQLYLLLSTPSDTPREIYKPKFSEINLKIMLALNGTMGRTILSQWLLKLGVPIWEANEWNELTHILQQLFNPTNYAQNISSKVDFFLIVIDIGLLNLSTDIWKEQLNFLHKFNKRAKFGWVLNHDTSNTIKIELRRRGYLLMVSGPLYKSKLIQIIETAINETPPLTFFPNGGDKIEVHEEIHDEEKGKNGKKCLEGLRILLAEDTPVLQRVATMMLEQMGAVVVVVGDGAQAVEALDIFIHEVKKGKKSIESTPYDLVLMDCQMPKMDGYEATKAIRRAEMESESHIPIVALTAHAMSSDEAKCLEVGMDAYLTKPIDCKLMVSTILSLTKSRA
ncbi:histidine kinase 1 [Lactuca sativa]|nr:histidine kinase 1 [Lactuca sativa]